MPNSVTSGEAHLYSLAPGQHSYKETLHKRWRAIGDTVFDFTGPGIEPQAFRTDNKVLNHYANWLVQ